MLDNSIKNQIINDAGDYLLKDNTYLAPISPHLSSETRYRTLSVIGCQSSGKSTLMNALFNTNFAVLDAKTAGRCQTTKGIWQAILSDEKIIIYDVEGVDSRERWEEGEAFAKSTSLFALVMSNILFINIWTVDIGRYQASQSQLLKTIFEINFRLFQNQMPSNKDPKKKLVFVFRDFDPENENYEKICKLFEDDMGKIWKEITKPKDFEICGWEQFFEISFVPLSHFRNSRFSSETKNLRQRLIDPHHESYLFKSISSDANTPLDGLQFYMERVWKKIRECKDLDLPNQKILMSIYRCGQIKAEIFQKTINPALEFINKRLCENIYSDLATDSSRVYTQALEDFETQTKYYDANEITRNRKEILEVLREHLNTFLTRQLSMIAMYAKKQMSIYTNKIKHEQQYFQNFESYAISYKRILQEELFEMIDKSVAPEIQYDTEAFKSNLSQELNDSFEVLKKNHLEKYTEYFLEKNLAGPIQEKIKNLFGRLTINFWLDFNSFYLEFYMQKESQYQNTLINSYKQSPQRVKELNAELRAKTEKLIEEILQGKTNELQYYLKEAFDDQFVRDKDGGAPRYWADYTNEEVLALYQQAESSCKDIARLFLNLEIFEYEKTLKEQEKSSNDKEEFKGVEVIENKSFKELCSEKILEQKIKTFELQAKETYNAANINAQKSGGFTGMLKSFGKSIISTVITKKAF